MQYNTIVLLCRSSTSFLFMFSSPTPEGKASSADPEGKVESPVAVPGCSRERWVARCVQRNSVWCTSALWSLVVCVEPHLIYNILLSCLDLPPASLSATSYMVTVCTRTAVPILTLIPLPLWSLSTAQLSALQPRPVSMMTHLRQMFGDGL